MENKIVEMECEAELKNKNGFYRLAINFCSMIKRLTVREGRDG